MKTDIEQVLDLLSNSKTRYTKKIRRGKYVLNKNYSKLVGDPCYCYSKKSKLEFLRNDACAILFLLAADYIRSELPKTANYNEKYSNTIHQEFIELASLSIMNLEQSE